MRGTSADGPTSTHAGPRICPLCEACCGLVFEMTGHTITRVSPNHSDLFSQGHSCAKGLGLARIDGDRDRIRTPLVRDGVHGFREATWEEAFDEINRRLPEYVNGDPGTCAVYTGNPAAHSLDPTFYLQALIAALRTRNLYSPASMDTLPKNLAQMLLYGTGLGLSIPDVDRTDYLLLLGSNPLVSNGSTLSAPGMDRRLLALRARGGTLVVVDPVRTRTAEVADMHLQIRPGTDSLFLLGVLSVIASEGLADPGDASPYVDGLDEALKIARTFSPAAVAPACGIDVEDIVSVARGFATANAAVSHSRIGTCMQEFGTLANWLVEVLTIVSGNLDRPGGAMFPMPPGGGQNTWPLTKAPVLTFDRWRSRVRGLPEAMGELPVTCFAEEILTPGPGRTRALIVIAGNPARSLPNSNAVEQALRSLEFMVAIDCYVNETTRYADVILPSPSLATRGHHDITLAHFAVRNVARYSPPLRQVAAGEMPEWQVLLRLSAIAQGVPDRPIAEMDDEVATVAARRAAKLAGCSVDDAMRATADRVGSERLLDLRLRSGPYGDRFGARPDGLTLAVLEANPNGIDYGPMQPRLPEVLRTPTGRIDLVPAMIVADLPRLRASMNRPTSGLLLINRRQRRGMNSWLHNALPQPDGGQCALLMSPQDAADLELFDGDWVDVTSQVATVTVELQVTSDMRPGVLSLPHGWGHEGPSLGTSRSAAVPGANYNALVDDTANLEPLTGSPVFNGVRVTVTRTQRVTV
ncbi:molybdopterin-dependent oxidoreductase [Mycobacterium sp.]|uniref:molybdopterin-dependent oxidoreductase n=1 Tax=Mycobacterium sp. TaxID=1785 RepID=UPI003BB0DC31